MEYWKEEVVSEESNTDMTSGITEGMEAPKKKEEAAASAAASNDDNNNNNEKLVVDQVSGGDDGGSGGEETAAAVDGTAVDTEESSTQTKVETKKKTKKNLVQVSNYKKPFVFYLNLAKKYIKQYNDVELTALGTAIPTVVTISEILKRNGLAVQKNIKTSTVDSMQNDKGYLIQKAKIEIVLGKADKQGKLAATAT